MASHKFQYDLQVGRAIQVPGEVSEALVKTLGLVRFGRGDYANGLRAVREILAETGMSLQGLQQTDGSGFARHPQGEANRASPALLCELLRFLLASSAVQVVNSCVVLRRYRLTEFNILRVDLAGHEALKS